MHPFNRTFSLAEVAKATGVEPKAISNWADRGLIGGHHDSVGRGHHRKFSWFNMMEIGCAAALLEVGIRSPADAFRAAARFAHSARGESGWVDEEGRFVPSGNQQAIRYPSIPFPLEHGYTFLFVAGEKSVSRPAHPSNQNFFWEVKHELGDPVAFIALDVSAVFERIVLALGYKPDKLLSEIYRPRPTSGDGATGDA